MTPDQLSIYRVNPEITKPEAPKIGIIVLFVILIIGFTTFIIKTKNKLINKIIYSILFINVLIITGFLIFKPEFFNLENDLVGKIILSISYFLTNTILLIKFRKNKILKIIFIILLIITIILQFFI